MAVDVTQILRRLDEDAPYLTAPAIVQVGDQLVENPDAKPMTLRKALIVALDHKAAELGFDIQRKRYRLAKLIKREDCPVFTAKHITMLQEVCAARYNPLLTGTIADLLEPDTGTDD